MDIMLLKWNVTKMEDGKKFVAKHVLENVGNSCRGGTNFKNTPSR